MKKVLIIVGLIVVFALLIFVNKNIQDNKYLSGKHNVVIDIKDYGKISLELDADVAPITVTNFIDLAKKGFYDGLTFHRIMKDFMMQGGAGVGAKNIKGEFSANGITNTISHVRGVISMARVDGDNNSASSQFFIVQKDSTFLDGQYAAFGHVTDGMDIVDKICNEAKPTDDNGSIEESQRPIINTIEVIN